MKVKGFSLLEVLVSVSLLGVITSTFTAGTMMMTRMVTDAEAKSKGILAAQQVLDEMRILAPSELPSTHISDSPINVIVEGTTYSVLRTYCAVSTYCPPTSSAETRHIKITVSKDNEQVYEVETVFTEFE